ncbi:flagellar hook-length control protein FliK [Maribius pontilimi]|uniref:Flagellar hook-length control protein FliK n=1 Tax=Palleronia pontilimi TaxID=1964209 RepID=A0A934IEX4_9RHOB|nr:flagellar hook-length control protein FliK [Palleronia pontilimi]MBJ3763162.1 flagellar hook-length control protein FliK [Palleronia pontilimi]
MILPGFVTPKGDAASSASPAVPQAAPSRNSAAAEAFSSVLAALLSRADSTGSSTRDAIEPASDEAKSARAEDGPTTAMEDEGSQDGDILSEDQTFGQSMGAATGSLDSDEGDFDLSSELPGSGISLSDPGVVAGDEGTDPTSVRSEEIPPDAQLFRSDTDGQTANEPSGTSIVDASGRLSAAFGSSADGTRTGPTAATDRLSGARISAGPTLPDSATGFGPTARDTRLENAQIPAAQSAGSHVGPSIHAAQVEGLGRSRSDQMMAPGAATPDDTGTAKAGASEIVVSRATSAAAFGLSDSDIASARSAQTASVHAVPPAQVVGGAFMQSQGKPLTNSEGDRIDARLTGLEDRIPSAPVMAQTPSPSAVRTEQVPVWASIATASAPTGSLSAQMSPMTLGYEPALFEPGSTKFDIGAAPGPTQTAPGLGPAMRGLPGLAPPPAAQIAQAIRTQNTGVIEISLSPEELGTVRISLQRSDGAMQVAIFAERDETMSLLRRHIEDLDAAFKDLDLGHVDISFEHRERQQGRTPMTEGTDTAGVPQSLTDRSQSQQTPRSALHAAPGGRLDLKL